MPFMAKQKPRPDRHLKRTASFRLNDAILRALDSLAERERRTKTVIIEMALEEYLAKAGLWPPGHDKPSK